MPKKSEGGLWDFSTSILLQKSEKIEGGPFGFFFEKLHNAKKTERGTFLGLLVQFARSNGQFDTIKFCRTILAS